MVEVTAKAPKVEKEATVMVDLGENVQDAIDRFGADVVFSNYIANVKIGVQSNIRRYLEAGLDQDAIQEKLNSFKPGVTMERNVDPFSAMVNKLKAMTDEERLAKLAELKEKLGIEA
jgi:hypothetical protein